jgi:hypothetical protein
VALAAVAFIPTFALTSAVVNNENLAFLFSAGAFLLLAPALSGRRPPTWSGALWLGAWIGLGGLAKLTTWYMLPLALLALYATAAWGWRKVALPAVAAGAFVLAGLWWPWHNLLVDGHLFVQYCAPTGMEQELTNLLLLDPITGIGVIAPMAWLVPLTGIIPEWTWSSVGFVRRTWIEGLVAGLPVALLALWAAARVVTRRRPADQRPGWKVTSLALGLAVIVPFLLWGAIVKQALAWDLKLLGGRYLLNVAPWISLALVGIGERASWLIPSRKVRGIVACLLVGLLVVWLGWLAVNLHAYYARID